MHWLQSTFANKFSRFCGDRGHVFQGRYKSLIIEGETGLLNVVDYIHLNPVRAGIVTVKQLKDYKNSSFPRYFKKRWHPNLKNEDFLEYAGGFSPTPNGMRSYHKRLVQIMEEDPDERARLHKDLNRGWYIGTKEGKTDLKLKIKQGVANANREAKTELESLRLEELLSSCLRHLGKGEHDIETDKKSAQWKIAIASHLKASTGIKNPHLWCSLKYGTPRNNEQRSWDL